MEAYYDSDDDVCWGPVPVKELRRDLLATCSKKDIKARNSIECIPSFKETRDFFEKIAPDPDPELASINRDRFRSLTELSSDDDFTDDLSEKTNLAVCVNSEDCTDAFQSDYNTSNIPIIVQDAVDKNYNCKLIEDNINFNDFNACSRLCSDVLHTVNPTKNESVILQDSNGINTSIKELSQISIDPQALVSKPKKDSLKNSIEICNNLIANIPDDSDKVCLSDNAGNVNINADFDQNSLINVQLKNSPSHFPCFDFNDTLEEMEQALKKGLNYSMSTKSSNILPNSNVQVTSDKSPKANFLKPKKPLGKFTNILSPVARYIKSSPRHFDAKLPMKPERKLSPAVHTKYKSIMSPVGVYIRNAPTTPLYKKITPSKNTLVRTCIKSAEKENLPDSFPEVVYKPAKHVFMQEEVDIKLPKNIESLLPIKPSVIKHQARSGKQNKSVNRKLLEDLTLNSRDDVSLQDTSISTKKRTYIDK